MVDLKKPYSFLMGKEKQGRYAILFLLIDHFFFLDGTILKSEDFFFCRYYQSISQALWSWFCKHWEILKLGKAFPELSSIKSLLRLRKKVRNLTPTYYSVFTCFFLYGSCNYVIQLPCGSVINHAAVLIRIHIHLLVSYIV